MAGHALADDVALCSTAIAGIARLLVTRGLLRSHEFVAVAAAAGVSIEQAGQFTRGELLLAPHQTLTLVCSAFERMRTMEVSAAELRTAQSPKPVTEETVQAAIAALNAKFPAWSVTVENLDSIPEFGAGKLVWHAVAGDKGYYGVYGKQAAKDERELAGKIGAVEAHLEYERDQAARFADGRGIQRRR